MFIAKPWISKLSEHPSADILRNFIVLFRFIAKSMVNSKNAHLLRNNDPYLIQIQCQYFTNGFFPTVFSHCFVLLFLLLLLRYSTATLCFLPFIWAMCLEFKWPLNVKLTLFFAYVKHWTPKNHVVLLKITTKSIYGRTSFHHCNGTEKKKFKKSKSNTKNTDQNNCRASRWQPVVALHYIINNKIASSLSSSKQHWM